MCWPSSQRNKSKLRACLPAACAASQGRRLLAAKGQDQLDQSNRQDDVADRHRDLIHGMPIQLCKFVKTVKKIQDKKDNAEQFDAAADETVAQIAEQNDSRLVARDVGS